MSKGNILLEKMLVITNDPLNDMFVVIGHTHVSTRSDKL